jgi:DNA-binding transcriptional LysR family regulator
MVIKNTQKLLPEFTISVIEVDSGDVAQALENGDIDVAFSRLNGALGPLISSKALIHDQLVVAVPSDHHLSEKKAISLTDLVNEDFVMCPRSITPTYFDAIMAACKKNNFSPRIVHEARSVSAQISLVGCAQGVALVPRNVSIPKGVITKPLKEKVNVVTLSISWNPARETEAVRNVIKTASTLLKTKVQD